MKIKDSLKWIVYFSALTAASAGLFYFNNHERNIEKEIEKENSTKKNVELTLEQVSDSVNIPKYQQILVDKNSFKNYLNQMDSVFTELSLKKNYTPQDSVIQETLQNRIQYGQKVLRQAESLEQRRNSLIRQRDSINNRIYSLYEKKWFKK